MTPRTPISMFPKKRTAIFGRNINNQYDKCVYVLQYTFKGTFLVNLPWSSIFILFASSPFTLYSITRTLLRLRQEPPITGCFCPWSGLLLLIVVMGFKRERNQILSFRFFTTKKTFLSTVFFFFILAEGPGVARRKKNFEKKKIWKKKCSNFFLA